MKNHHKCNKMKGHKNDAIIYKWQNGDGREDLVGKWTLDVFGHDGGRVLVVVNNCSYCGKLLEKEMLIEVVK